jgi:hypothetical protein
VPVVSQYFKEDTENPGLLNQAIVVVKLSFDQVQPVYNSMKTDRISEQLYTSGMPSVGLNENVEHSLHILYVPDKIVRANSERDDTSMRKDIAA